MRCLFFAFIVLCFSYHLSWTIISICYELMQVNVVDKILHELLQSGDSAQNYMQGSRRMKLDNRIHLDNKVQECKMPGIAFTQALQSHSKRSKKHMSMKQHKKHGSLDLPPELHKWAFPPLCKIVFDNPSISSVRFYSFHITSIWHLQFILVFPELFFTQLHLYHHVLNLFS